MKTRSPFFCRQSFCRVLTVLLFAPLAALHGADAPAESRSVAKTAGGNINFILSDDLGLPGFGCTGGIYKTPNIDALAAGGTRFEYFFPAPLCEPTGLCEV